MILTKSVYLLETLPSAAVMSSLAYLLENDCVSEMEPLYLTLGSEDGTEQQLILTPAREGLRLAVGSLKERSSIWRVTATKNDVYVAAAGLGQSMKFSFHESGVWRQAYLSEEHAARAGVTGKPQFNNDPRVVDRWEQPEGANGWMHALTVWVPYGQLTPLPEEVENPRKPIHFVPKPEPCEEVGLHFAVVRPDQGLFDPAEMRLVDGFRLPDKRALIVFTSRRAIEPAREQWILDMAVVALAMTQGTSIKVFGDPIRVGLFTNDADGSRSVLDVRAPSRETLEQVNRTGLTVNTTYTPPGP